MSSSVGHGNGKRDKEKGGNLKMGIMHAQAVPKVFDLEKSSYPPDEAASFEAIEYRASVTGGLCQIAQNALTKEIVGFVTATAAPKGTERMTESMMKEHFEGGTVVCIHSVVIDANFRRRGLGKEMLSVYVNNIKDMGKYDRILLISKQYLIRFYESVGFSVVGQSAISHGKDTWTEMEMSLIPQ